MICLGIETSCDETSVALVENGRRILSNVVVTSADFHRKHGGVIPEIASRMQLQTIDLVAKAALKEAGVNLKSVKLVSVTSGPGLLGSLLVGISFAKTFSYGLSIPLIGVNHVISHFYANFLENKSIDFPFVALVASGGHTSLFYVKDFNKIELLSATLDDACGEAFDKVAKILGLGYPGGPVIEKLALKGNSGKVKFNCSVKKNELGFSFSGIKTAVLYYAKDLVHTKKKLSTGHARDICASFQKTVIETLVEKSIIACKKKKVKNILLGGGVIANKSLRDRFKEASIKNNLDCFFPSMKLCMDNAAMIAGYGFQLFKKGYCSNLYLNHDLT